MRNKNHPLNILIMATGLILWAHQALAGGWTSGGGELIKDGHNPWFFAKTGEFPDIVRYCISIDEVHFGLDAESIDANVEAAFGFWRDEFSATGQDESDEPGFRLAQEHFVKVDCKIDPPLRLQFGILSAEQEAKMKELGWHPNQHVAIAIRTDYNPKTLKGRGFIYVAPETGRLAIDNESVRPNYWSGDMPTLRNVLFHELGHVFGLRHRGTRQDIMGAGLTEFAISHDYNPDSVKLNLFAIPRGVPVIRSCGHQTNAMIKKFLGDENTNSFLCYGVRFFADRLDVVGYRDVMTPQFNELIGSAWIRGGNRDVEPLVRLWLSGEQKVFPMSIKGINPVIYGAKHETRIIGTTYTSASDPLTQQQLLVQLKPGNIRVGAWNQGRFFDSLFDIR